MKQLEQLEELCLDIFAHYECDYEITLSGNGVNCAEAAGVAYAILDILHQDGRKWVKDNQEKINNRAQELRSLYGY